MASEEHKDFKDTYTWRILSVSELFARLWTKQARGSVLNLIVQRWAQEFAVKPKGRTVRMSAHPHPRRGSAEGGSVFVPSRKDPIRMLSLKRYRFQKLTDIRQNIFPSEKNDPSVKNRFLLI